MSVVDQRRVDRSRLTVLAAGECRIDRIVDASQLDNLLGQTFFVEHRVFVNFAFSLLKLQTVNNEVFFLSFKMKPFACETSEKP